MSAAASAAPRGCAAGSGACSTPPGACTLVAGSCAATPLRPLPAIDGISDQSLPAWGGSFTQSPLGAKLLDRATGPFAGVSMARYVVQWNAISEPSAAAASPSAAQAGPAGNYRERWEAWLHDVGEAKLTPVLALTSYDGSRPELGEYATELAALLARASALGHPIAYVEPWNEPNNQGHEPAATAARMADAAYTTCARTGCTVVAGDFEDDAGMLAYERAYAAVLTFTPTVWGVHPYAALADRDVSRLLALRTALVGSAAAASAREPGPDRPPQLWFTEIAAFACRAGHVQGPAAQLAEADYLRSQLLPAVDPAHTFYYGVMAADRMPASCSGPGGEDPELYEPDEVPRAAAAAVLAGAAPSAATLAAFGPAPG